MRTEEVAVVGGLGLAAVAVVGTAVALAAARKEPEPEPPNGIEIYWYDKEGNPIPRNSPVTLDEGETAYFDVFITNTTTKAGLPWEATFDVSIASQYGTPPYEPMGPAISAPGEYFAAGERKGPWSGSVTPYVGSAARDGNVTVIVSRLGVEIAWAVDIVTIVEVEIIYGAIIEI